MINNIETDIIDVMQKDKDVILESSVEKTTSKDEKSIYDKASDNFTKNAEIAAKLKIERDRLEYDNAESELKYDIEAEKLKAELKRLDFEKEKLRSEEEREKERLDFEKERLKSEEDRDSKNRKDGKVKMWLDTVVKLGVAATGVYLTNKTLDVNLESVITDREAFQSAKGIFDFSLRDIFK